MEGGARGALTSRAARGYLSPLRFAARGEVYGRCAAGGRPRILVAMESAEQVRTPSPAPLKLLLEPVGGGSVEKLGEWYSTAADQPGLCLGISL